MTDISTAAPPILPMRASSLRIVVAMLAALILATAVQLGLPGIPGQRDGFVDFHVFHLAGSLALENDLATAYHTATFAPLQAGQPGFSAYMPYTYPPQFNLLTAALATLPHGMAYLVLVGASFAGWLIVLHRLCGADGSATAVLMMVLPAAIVTARFGQNGFLSGALIGAACLYAPRGRGGVALGLMAYKPHLALGVGLAALFRGRWRVILVAAAVASATALIASLAFGFGIWRDFGAAARESGAFLNDGAYPLFRMTSVYAGLRSFGVPASAAMTGHVAVALAGILLLGLASARGWTARRVFALGALCCLVVSPYAYDYDLAIAAVAVALASGDIATRLRSGERALLLAALWFGSGWGLLQLSLSSAPKSEIPSLGALGVLAAAGLILLALLRAEAARPAAAPA